MIIWLPSHEVIMKKLPDMTNILTYPGLLQLYLQYKQIGNTAWWLERLLLLALKFLG